MKRYEYAELTVEQLDAIKKGVELEETFFTEKQWIPVVMLLGSFGNEKVESVFEWFMREIRDYEN